MANDHNHITVIGRLGADPEVRQTQSGGVTNIRVAVGWKGKSGDGTDWFSVTAFGKLGEIMAQYLRKGSQVMVAGRMRSREYENKQGQRVTAWEIIASDMQMLGNKGDSTNSGQHQNQRPAPQQAAPQQDGGRIDFDDDIPF